MLDCSKAALHGSRRTSRRGRVPQRIPGAKPRQGERPCSVYIYIYSNKINCIDGWISKYIYTYIYIYIYIYMYILFVEREG